MPVIYSAIPTDTARLHQAGCPDASLQRPDRSVSDGYWNLCRKFLKNIPAGAGTLVLAHRPFPAPPP